MLTTWMAGLTPELSDELLIALGLKAAPPPKKVEKPADGCAGPCGQDSPADAEFKLCVVQFKVPGAKNGGSDKRWQPCRLDPDRKQRDRGGRRVRPPPLRLER